MILQIQLLGAPHSAGLFATQQEYDIHPAMQHLAQLPVSERIDLVQELWDSIVDSREKMPIKDWQRELVAARLAEVEGDPSTLLARE